MRALSEVDFRLLFESAPGLYLVLSPELTIAGASDAYLRATMTEREAIVGHNLYDIFPDNPDSQEHALGSENLRTSLQRVLKQHTADVMPVQRYDIRRPAAEGGQFEARYWSPCNLPILDEKGELLWILHCVEDVTSFVQLLETEGGSQTIMHTPHIENRQEIQRRLEQTYLAIVRLARGLEQHVAERTAQLEAANRRLVEELAERQRLEEQFRQAQKMEAVGRLAAGVAHDFNNLLTVIQGYGDTLLSSENDPRRVNRLQQILRASERAAGLTRQLLAFSRQQILQPQVLDLNAVITDTCSMLRRVIGEDVELHTVLASELGRIKADGGQIEQILMNLTVNARDAMPEGGQLTIETANAELDATSIGRFGAAVQPGAYIQLAVSDTGIGMDAATQEKIFEPFFTTKGIHKGTGLGLSTVYGIVKQSDGHILVYSEPGHGTCFKIYFPRVNDDHTPVERGAEAAAILTGDETILLVEDEEAIRELVSITLQEQGYRVIAFGKPQEGLTMLASNGQAVQLLLTDLVMAGMNGRTLYENAQRLNPELKVLYMSGYTDDTVVHKGIIEAGMPFLQKPFRRVDLLRKVRVVLDARKKTEGKN